MSDVRSLKAILEWIDERDGDQFDTLANVRIELDGQPIWPVWGDAATDLEVFADDFLSFLTENWKKLFLEQLYPAGLQPAAPSRLLAMAEVDAADLERARAEALYEAVDDFEAAHELTRAIGGQFGLPNFWMIRRSDYMLVETAGRTFTLPLDAWRMFATDFGQTIANRLTLRLKDKYARLLAAWDQRDEGDPVSILSLSIGQPRAVSEELIKDGIVNAEASVTRAANDNDVLRIAARMVGAAPYLQIKTILSSIAATPAGSSEQLDKFATAIQAALIDLPPGGAPHEEGVYAAQRLREKLGIAAALPVDPFAVLDGLQVPVLMQSLKLTTLDALAVWGEGHGPAVVMNVDSRRFASYLGPRMGGPTARATAAHEICHLLLDRGQALAAVDILNGRIPRVLERRAGAFAAEFLLPARTAASLWRQSEFLTTREGVTAMLKRLSARFSVSRQMAAWQLDHGLMGSDQNVLFLLDDIYPQRLEHSARH